MKIVNIKVFKGRNVYLKNKCIKLNLDLEGYDEISSEELYDFNENLIHMFPDINKTRDYIDENRGFIKRNAKGIYIANLTEYIILAFHNKIGIKINHERARMTLGDNYYVIYQYEYRNTGIEAANMAVDFINSLINKNIFDFSLRLIKLKNILMKEQLGVSTLDICNEAQKRGIPILPIVGNCIFQLGYGRYSKMIQETLGSDTSEIAVNTAQDKLLTKELLNMNFLPTASGMKVTGSIDLIMDANDIGYPVVLKPQFGHGVNGVSSIIRDDKELKKAYEFLIKDYEDIILEKYISGRRYRVFSVYGDIVAVSEKMSLLNDDAKLATREFDIDCTNLICEENIEICKRTASSIGLDICSMDLICENISKSLNGGVITGISASPDIEMHYNPSSGVKRNVAGYIVDKLFENKPNDIPIVAITGTNGKTTTTRLISHILSIAGYTVGMTTTSGIYIGGKCIFTGDTTGPSSALAVLANKDVDAAVLETARGGIIRKGLAYNLADIGVITNITEDHLGIDGVDTIQELAKVKSLVGEAVKTDGYVVINGDDDMSVSIIHRLKSNLIVFSSEKNNEIMQKNIKNGGYGVYVDNDYIIIQQGTTIKKLIDIKNIGITINGILKYNIENAMAACGAAIGLGIDYDTLKQGLMSFHCNQEQNPGRFNMYLVNNVTVVLDYGHNIEGYKCVLDGIKHIKHNKLIGVIGVPGDRLDSDILEVGKCAGENLDCIFIKEDKDRRGRDKGKVADILEKGILKSNFHGMKIKKVLDEAEAFKNALNLAEPGDLIIIFFEKAEPLIEIMKIRNYEVKFENKLLVKSYPGSLQ
ncbi:Mur ligase family protein [Clostridium psychrophilum]|uniref:Mur ligase family protein n=1 Tax=Clostridium psychrophilum TaxID=132926 RepID=UPI001C0C02C7|nr:Mur ligase family protein [Clostridium psychrophilum]MBU3181099.1 cyanophycin synthetase [Clostridium psychrophilum]